MKKRRSDCFWGLHSDFHAVPSEGCVIGATMTESDLREIMEIMHPDFVQVDCKGHPGYTSYPSQMGNAMPEFSADPLEMWRKVTREYGVRLYVHFSGVYDIKYFGEHPQECVVRADGTAAPYVRLDGAYADEYFIPQISEIVQKYEVDGIWVDGDCWAVQNDYRPETLLKFERAVGISLEGKIPAQKGDPFFEEYTDFTRQLFREYLRHYVDALHRRFPKLEICSNWAFSDHMPEAVCADVDFLSGDLAPWNCFNSARYAGRMLAMHGKVWDLMSWGFRYKVYNTPLIPLKRPAQLMQEAASVISMGGAFQNNISQFKDASPDMCALRQMVPLAQFMRERREFCFGGKPIPQAALLVASEDRYREINAPFSREGKDKLMGLTALLCDSGQSLEIIGDHYTAEQLAHYPLIIVPELYAALSETLIEKLRGYTMAGGSLLLVGKHTAEIFADAGFPFEIQEHHPSAELPNWYLCNIGHCNQGPSSTEAYYFSVDDADFGVVSAARLVLAENGRTVGRIHESVRKAGVPFALTVPCGKGRVGVIAADLGTQYFAGMQEQHHMLIRKMSDLLYDPLARIESVDGIVEIVCLEKDGRLMLQLVNAGGQHTDEHFVCGSRIPPAENVCLSVRCDTPPAAIVLQPAGQALAFEYRDGRVRFKIDRLDIHSVAEFRE